jgi:hypothetical protein
VRDVADVYEVYPSSMFRVEVCKIVRLESSGAERWIKVGIGTSFGPVGTLNQKICINGPFKGIGVHHKSLGQL